MATAKKMTRVEAYDETVKRYRTVPHGVDLVLTHDEAQALRTLFGSIGGDPTASGRGKIDAVCTALEDAGYGRDDSKYLGKIKGTIIFADDEPYTW